MENVHSMTDQQPVTLYFAEACGEAPRGPLHIWQELHRTLSPFAERYGGTAHVGFVYKHPETHGAVGHCSLYDEMKAHGFEAIHPVYSVIGKVQLSREPSSHDLSRLCNLLAKELNVTLFKPVVLPVPEA